MGLLEKDRESRKMWDGMFFKDSVTTWKKKRYCDFKLILSLLWSVHLFNGCFPPSKRDIEMGNHCAILTDITEKYCATLETWRSQPTREESWWRQFFWIHSVLFWKRITLPPLSTVRKDLPPVCNKLRFHWSLRDLNRGRAPDFENGGNWRSRNFPANPQINRFSWGVGVLFPSSCSAYKAAGWALSQWLWNVRLRVSWFC